jgi:hypothetical protein
LIGPLRLSPRDDSIELGERRSAGIHQYFVSTIRAGSVHFESRPGESIELHVGSRLAIHADSAHPLLAYIQPDKDGVRIELQGTFDQLNDSGQSLCPTLLRELWAWPWLRLVVAASLGVGSALLAAAKRLGIRT